MFSNKAIALINASTLVIVGVTYIRTARIIHENGRLNHMLSVYTQDNEELKRINRQLNAAADNKLLGLMGNNFEHKITKGHEEFTHPNSILPDKKRMFCELNSGGL